MIRDNSYFGNEYVNYPDDYDDSDEEEEEEKIVVDVTSKNTIREILAFKDRLDRRGMDLKMEKDALQERINILKEAIKTSEESTRAQKLMEIVGYERQISDIETKISRLKRAADETVEIFNKRQTMNFEAGREIARKTFKGLSENIENTMADLTSIKDEIIRYENIYEDLKNRAKTDISPENQQKIYAEMDRYEAKIKDLEDDLKTAMDEFDLLNRKYSKSKAENAQYITDKNISEAIQKIEKDSKIVTIYIRDDIPRLIKKIGDEKRQIREAYSSFGEEDLEEALEELESSSLREKSYRNPEDIKTIESLTKEKNSLEQQLRSEELRETIMSENEKNALSKNVSLTKQVADLQNNIAKLQSDLDKEKISSKSALERSEKLNAQIVELDGRLKLALDANKISEETYKKTVESLQASIDKLSAKIKEFESTETVKIDYIKYGDVFPEFLKVPPKNLYPYLFTKIDLIQKTLEGKSGKGPDTNYGKIKSGLSFNDVSGGRDLDSTLAALVDEYAPLKGRKTTKSQAGIESRLANITSESGEAVVAKILSEFRKKVFTLIHKDVSGKYLPKFGEGRRSKKSCPSGPKGKKAAYSGPTGKEIKEAVYAILGKKSKKGGEFLSSEIGRQRGGNTVVRLNYSPNVRAFLDGIKNNSITSITVYKQPVQEYVEKLANIISLGKYEQNKARFEIDKMVHVFMICMLDDGSKILIEKNQTINIMPFSGIPRATGNYWVGYVDINVADFFSNAQKAMGDQLYFGYDPQNNNCQVYLASLLKYNGLLNQDMYDFTVQNTDEIVGTINPISKGIIDAGILASQIFDYVLNGAGL